MFNPHLFQVYLRPSFGASAPPSPDLTFYAYTFLRRVGRLFAFRFTCFTTESVPTRRTLCKFLLNLGEMPSPRLIVIPIRAKRLESVPTRRTLCKFLLNLGEIPSPRDVVINQNSKRQRGDFEKLK